MIRRPVSGEKALPVGSSSPSVSYGYFVFCTVRSELKYTESAHGEHIL